MRKSLTLAALLAATVATPVLAQDDRAMDRRIERHDREQAPDARPQQNGGPQRQQVAPPVQAAPVAPQGRWDGNRNANGYAQRPVFQGQQQAAPGQPWMRHPEARSDNPAFNRGPGAAPAPVVNAPRVQTGDAPRWNGAPRDGQHWNGQQSDRPQWNGQPRDAQNWNGQHGPDGHWDGRRDDGHRWNGNAPVRQDQYRQNHDHQDWDRDHDRNHNGDWNNNRSWSRDWRQDRRYDWQRYRNDNRYAFRSEQYYAPYGWNYGYRRFSIGFSLSNILFDQQYWIDDPYAYRLPPAYGPYRWVRYYDDVLLVDLRSGRVVDAIYDFFW